MSFKLALSYLKHQRGRSLALITSIALAVVLVFTLNAIPETQSKLNIKEAYKNFSDFHVEYTDLDKEIVEKLKKDKTIKEIHNIVSLGNIVDKNGVSINLNSYSKDFVDAYGYKLIKGSKPQNENEIILEEKALKEMGLKCDLGQTIDFKVVKKYIDKNNQNQLFSKDKRFKLVGIIQKPDGYYEDNVYYQVKGFTYYKETQDIIPKELVGYNGILKFNTKTPSMVMTNKAINKYDLNDMNFTINVSLKQVLDDYKMMQDTKFSKKNKLIPMASATLVIYNIFNIILIDMTKQIGMLRAIGLSKKNIRFMLFIQSTVVLVTGLVIGFGIGTLSSYVGLRCIYGNITELYISKASVIEPIKMAVVSVLLSSIFVIYKSGKISPMEAIRDTYKSNTNQKNRFYHKLIRKVSGITGEMAYKNVWRNKARTILSVLSISLAGTLFIGKMVVYKNSQAIGDTSMQIMTMGKSDIILKKHRNNTDENFTSYDEKYINKISKIKEIKDIQPSMNLSGYLKANFNDLSDDYKAPFELTSDKDNIEVNLAFKGYSNDTLENLNNFIEYGSNIIDNSQADYPSALISNNFYSASKGSNDAKVLKDIKINDLIDLKIPVNKNGKLEYKNQKIKVAGILNKDYVIDQDGGLDGGFQVILNKKDYKDITGSSNYNKISLRVKKGTDKEVIKKLEQITKGSSFVDIESKYKYRNFFTEDSEKNKETVLISVLLTLLISSINIICIIRTNIILRINELATLRAIGMSMKKIKSMIIKESLIYGVLSILVSATISTYDYFKFIRMVNYGHSQGLGKENVMKFTIPVTEILQFGVVTLLICLVAVYLSKNKIEKISIVEGLRVNE